MTWMRPAECQSTRYSHSWSSSLERANIYTLAGRCQCQESLRTRKRDTGIRHFELATVFRTWFSRNRLQRAASRASLLDKSSKRHRRVSFLISVTFRRASFTSPALVHFQLSDRDRYRYSLTPSVRRKMYSVSSKYSTTKSPVRIFIIFDYLQMFLN